MPDRPPDSLEQTHKCFGCGRQIGNMEPHIHVGLDEVAAQEGLGDPLGLDDILTFAFCLACTRETDKGREPEAHDIGEAD